MIRETGLAGHYPRHLGEYKMAVLEIFSVIGSPLIGILGGFLQRKHERSMRKLDNEEKSASRSHELAMTKLHMQAKAQETEQEIALTEVKGDFEVLKAGIKAEGQLSNIEYGKSVWGDIANFTRAMIRPTVTLYLLIAVSLYAGHELLETGITDENRILMIAMVDAFLMTLAFWFASRAGSYRTKFNDGTYTRGV